MRASRDLRISLWDLNLTCACRCAGSGPDAALNRLDEASSFQVLGRPYQRGIFPERQDGRHGRRKTAGNNGRDFRACHGNSVAGRAMDLAALVRGFLGSVMTALLAFFVQRSVMEMTVPMVAGVVNRILDTEAQPRATMQSNSICAGEKPGLSGRHDQEDNRQQCPKRYTFQDRDSTKIFHRLVGTVVRVICQGRLRQVCCSAIKSERNRVGMPAI